MKQLFVLGLCTLFLFAAGQNGIKKYVQANAIPLSSIEVNDTDYADLEPLGKAIGDAAIVMMGEQDHGDGAGYFAKVRLIKYLHERKGFNVVAFEGDFVNINNDWDEARRGTMPLENFVQKNFRSTWADCNGSSPLFKQYLPFALKTKAPLEIAAFDTNTETRSTFALLDSVLERFKIPLTQSPQYKSTILPLLQTFYKYTGDTLTTDKIIGYYGQMKDELLLHLPKSDFWITVIDNLITQNREFRNRRRNVWQNFNDRNIRDKQMAANLRWLSDVKYPTEKIIVWAHNYHVSKYAGHYPEDFLNNAKMMGSVLTADTAFSGRTYVMGFTSRQGTAGRPGAKTYDVSKAKAAGFENWIAGGYAYAFVDFKEYNLQHPLNNESFFMNCSVMSPFHRAEKAQWAKIFDGVFYIRDTYRCAQATDEETTASRQAPLR